MVKRMCTPHVVLLVEDEPLWQAGVRDLLLTAAQEFSLAGVAADYDEAMRLFAALQPDWVLLDWKIYGERDGLAVGEMILQTGFPPERIVLITGSPPSSIPAHPFLYVPKTALFEALLPLLRSVTAA